MTQYFEDLSVGDTREFGSYEVTEEEIREFAERYDPQTIHLDPEAAETLDLGGLIASGWHTASMTMRMLVDNVVADQAPGVGKGVDGLRWLRPVRPGDVLSVRIEVIETRPRDDGRGEVHLRVETLDGDDNVVMTMVSKTLVGTRGA